ncbi:DUF3298 and DUF4163 domain-containing protein [Clostridium sp. Sa3CUN1]|uniref:DUF3298 and DUF4163 domain-containing protein n=1 Tax=Clostridium gallinarum TaxID=2762246 RepID=A0ABR8Q0P9_9CLOT|nr:DUF3298 and DUF4163 domain-containing protein [Clostridium gallinarum]MBD7913980.1 DUF3298 and DUF4163 domain-containing protein [Clostridium gallinarum]
MKKIKKIILIAFLSINIITNYPQSMLININKINVESVNIVDKIIKEKTSFINIDVEIPQIVGLVSRKKEEEINNEILEWTNLWIKDTKDTSEKLMPTIPYELQARYLVTNNKDILSFYTDYYQFSGGAHGITTRNMYNINTYSGDKVLLKDLFEEGYDYKTFINNQIYKEINKQPENYFQGKEGFNGIKDDQDFYIKNDKIIIHFPYYEIAPYVTGMPEFEIDYKINTDLLKG